METINLDVNALSRSGKKSIQRAAVFMGIGIKSVSTDDPVDYDLTNVVMLQVAEKATSKKDQKNIKTAYRQWIVSCGLRELTEGFAIFLDKIYHTCLIVEIYHHRRLSVEDAQKYYKKFHFKGTEEKFEILDRQFAIKTDKAIYFTSISQVRNCITHRGSIVEKVDLNAKDRMEMKWLRLNLYVKKPDGVKVSLETPIPSEGIYLKDGGHIMLEYEEKTLEFKQGEAICNPPIFHSSYS